MRLRAFLCTQLVLVLAPVVSCVTEYDSEAISTPSSLIVEGMITNQPGPYSVKLTRTADYSYKGVNILEAGSTVTILDNLGNKEILTEQSPGGTYLTSSTGIQGIVGRTYRITIKTRTGEKYESDPEVLKASPPISRIYSEYRYDSQASTNRTANGWDVYLDTKDPATAGDFYRWEWTHYELAIACRTEYVEGDYARQGYPCCSPCWDITRCNVNCINLMSDVNINGNSISRQFIERVPYDASTRYYVEIKQQLLSKGIYEFFKTAKQQVTSTGGLFDAAPSVIASNIHATSNASLHAYGYFGAVGESIGFIRVDRSKAIGEPEPTTDAVVVDTLAACTVCANTLVRTPNRPRLWQF